MYAVIATGGKQYRVENGTILKVEKLDAEPGTTVEFGEVLLIADGDSIKVGAPLLKGGKVTATVEKHGKGEKKVIVKFRRRKHYLRQGTHRQQFTQVKITGISA
jgi:large subunit ribosomal protein L21